MFFPCRSSILSTTIPPPSSVALTTLLHNRISPLSPFSSLAFLASSPSLSSLSLSGSPSHTPDSRNPAIPSRILLSRSSILLTVSFFHSCILLPGCSAHFFATASALPLPLLSLPPPAPSPPTP